MQAVVKNALEPEWEAKFEPGSYGFRPGRSCHDAIGRIYTIAAPHKRKHWVVDADITGAFDNIRHDTISDALCRFPAKGLITAWLKAGMLEKEHFEHTEMGTPQGGVISPLLANVALHGLETAVGVSYRKNGDRKSLKGKRALVRYADDFVIFAESEADAYAAKQDVMNWLKERGLTLSEEKTKVCHLTEGFDFLGYNIQHYPVSNTKTGFKLLIKPSKKSVITFQDRLKQEWTASVGHNAGATIKKMTPILRGWANYFRQGVSGKTFRKLDKHMFYRTVRWCKRTHPHKPWKWIRRTYFHRVRNDNWVFGTETAYLPRISWTPIVRHIMVRHDASPDDGTLREYWEWRNRRKLELTLRAKQATLARLQEGKCPHCHDTLNNEEELHIHHIVSRSKGGSNRLPNLQLVHLYCHQQKHRRKP
jgi:RNA-directed DNA polymerase